VFDELGHGLTATILCPGCYQHRTDTIEMGYETCQAGPPARRKDAARPPATLIRADLVDP